MKDIAQWPTHRQIYGLFCLTIKLCMYNDDDGRDFFLLMLNFTVVAVTIAQRRNSAMQ